MDLISSYLGCEDKLEANEWKKLTKLAHYRLSSGYFQRPIIDWSFGVAQNEPGRPHVRMKVSQVKIKLQYPYVLQASTAAGAHLHHHYS